MDLWLVDEAQGVEESRPGSGTGSGAGLARTQDRAGQDPGQDPGLLLSPWLFLRIWF